MVVDLASGIFARFIFIIVCANTATRTDVRMNCIGGAALDSELATL